MKPDTKVLHEITPLGDRDFMYVADRYKSEFNYPIHCHDMMNMMELNFVKMRQAVCAWWATATR